MIEFKQCWKSCEKVQTKNTQTLEYMEEPGEQCTVVFTLIFTEPASGREVATTPPPTHTFACRIQNN